jgi:hypothetical protein
MIDLFMSSVPYVIGLGFLVSAYNLWRSIKTGGSLIERLTAVLFFGIFSAPVLLFVGFVVACHDSRCLG